MFQFNKPKHKEKVIATNKGWVVERTGEVLVSHKNLADKIALVKSISDEDIKQDNPSVEQTVVDVSEEEQNEPEQETASENSETQDTEAKEEKPKRRGRPPRKAKVESAE